MGIVFWAIVAGAGAAGYAGYRRLKTMEDELRTEVATEAPSSSERQDEQVAPTSPLEERILALVAAEPGRLQTAIYGEFESGEKRALQELLREMDRAGKLKRVREKGTYRLYPAD